MEYVDIVDEDNNLLGFTATRNEAHEKNLWHRHASGWIMNKKGDILLQQRAFTKKKNPGKWAKTGGHVDAGEEPIDAFKREVFEEIGLKLDDKDIINLEIFKSSKPSEHFFSHGYLFITDKKEDEFTLQKEEVNQVKYFTIEELEELKRKDDKNYTFADWEDEGFYKQMKYLKKERNKLLS